MYNKLVKRASYMTSAFLSLYHHRPHKSSNISVILIPIRSRLLQLSSP